MKKFIGSTAALVIFASSQVTALENSVRPAILDIGVDNPQVALLVGNSFSFYNCGVHGYLKGLNKSLNPRSDWRMRMTTTSSAPLSLQPLAWYLGEHEQEPYAADGKKGTPRFDVVIIQPHSAATTSKNRIPFFNKYVKEHARTIRQSGAKPLLVMTWAYKDKPEQIKAIADTTTRIGNEAETMVAPVGLAFAKAKNAMPSLELIVSDKRHPTAAGSYLYGAVLHAVLFKHSPVGASYVGGCEKPLDPKIALYLQQTAWETVTQYYGWEQ